MVAFGEVLGLQTWVAGRDGVLVSRLLRGDTMWIGPRRGFTDECRFRDLLRGSGLAERFWELAVRVKARQEGSSYFHFVLGHRRSGLPRMHFGGRLP